MMPQVGDGKACWVHQCLYMGGYDTRGTLFRVLILRKVNSGIALETVVPAPLRRRALLLLMSDDAASLTHTCASCARGVPHCVSKKQHEARTATRHLDQVYGSMVLYACCRNSEVKYPETIERFVLNLNLRQLAVMVLEGSLSTDIH